jgi:chemotaxis response regulator CheB
MSRIKVLVVDDSALMRRLLIEFLNGDPAIEVVAPRRTRWSRGTRSSSSTRMF